MSQVQSIITPPGYTTTPNSRFPDWAKLTPYIIAIVSLCISGVLAYNTNDKQTVQRLTVVETQQYENRLNLNRIENRLDKLDDKLDTVLERLGTGTSRTRSREPEPDPTDSYRRR